VPARFVSEEVADGLLERTNEGERILIYGAQEARDVLPETLRAENRSVDTYAAYKTRPVHDPAIANAANEADIWTFASASAVRSFVENVPDAAALSRRKVVACIGPVTADAAREAGLEVAAVPDDYTVDGLVDVLTATVATPA
jgi:uroporphyrinogen III methyltransferase/synthase